MVDRCVTLVESTSPSALLAASLDSARHAAAVDGRALLHESLRGLALTREAVREVPGLDVLDERLVGAAGVFAYDPLRLTIDVRGTLSSGYELARLLRDQDVHVELAGENVMVAVFGMGEDTARAGERLVAALHRAVETLSAGERDPEPEAFAPPPPWGELVMTPREAFLGRQEVVPVREAVGRVAAESLAAYPPGIPNVLPGERLTVETLAYIQQALEHGGSLRGASDRELRTLRVVAEARRGYAFAADRLHQAVGAASAERERGQLGVVDGQAEGAQALVEFLGLGRRQHPVAAEADAVDAELEGGLERDGDDLDALGLEPLHEAVRRLLDADRGQLLAEHAGEHVDVEEVGRDALDPDLPAVVLQPLRDLAGGLLLGALLAGADGGDAGLDDHEVAALEGARGDHLGDRDALALVEADRGRVLAPAPVLGGLGDDRAARDVDARVAREDLVGQVGVGLEEVDVDPVVLVDGDHLGVLLDGVLAAEHEIRGERGARDGAGGQPVEVVGGTEQDVEQAAILGVDAPVGLGRHRGIVDE